MLKLERQGGSRECARYHVSSCSVPAILQGAGFFDSPGESAGLSEPSEVPPRTESVPASPGAMRTGHDGASSARAWRIPPSRQTVDAVGIPQLLEATTLISNHTFWDRSQQTSHDFRKDMLGRSDFCMLAGFANIPPGGPGGACWAAAGRTGGPRGRATGWRRSLTRGPAGWAGYFSVLRPKRHGGGGRRQLAGWRKHTHDEGRPGCVVRNGGPPAA